MIMQDNSALQEGPAAPEKPQSEKKNLGLRTITGAVYALILVGTFLLKIFVSDLFFDALVLVFAFFGTGEMIRAFKEKLHVSQKVLIIVFALAVIAAYALSDFYYADVLGIALPEHDLPAVGRNYSMHITFIVLIAGMAVLASLLVFSHGHVSLESTGYALLCYIYPAVFLLVITICNHLEYYSELAIMIVFVVAPFADVFAFFFGKLFGKKLPAKMAPNISPKKTIIGGFGGLLGGAIGAVAIFFIYYGLTRPSVIGLFAQTIRPIAPDAKNLIFFIALGILTAAFSQFGDLVESAIKRKLGIKDMGKILPGHGGVLDRIDSSLFAGLIVCVALVAKLMLLG